MGNLWLVSCTIGYNVKNKHVLQHKRLEIRNIIHIFVLSSMKFFEKMFGRGFESHLLHFFRQNANPSR